jgi:hypothetical protein
VESFHPAPYPHSREHRTQLLVHRYVHAAHVGLARDTGIFSVFSTLCLGMRCMILASRVISVALILLNRVQTISAYHRPPLTVQSLWLAGQPEHLPCIGFPVYSNCLYNHRALYIVAFLASNSLLCSLSTCMALSRFADEIKNFVLSVGSPLVVCLCNAANHTKQNSLIPPIL